MKVKSLFVYWGPVVFWCLVIFTLSSIPTLPTVEIIWWDFVLKKSAHITEYAVLYFLVFCAVNKINLKSQISPASPRLGRGRANLKATSQNSKLKKNKSDWLYPLVFSILYAFSDEFHQKFVPGRHSQLTDIGFDFSGMLISLYYLRCTKNSPSYNN